jgi:gliding motility-associated-like protein
MHAQLGFCQGNSGNSIFTETFGSGTTSGPELPAGITTYNFVGNGGPQDGEYTIGRNTFFYGWNLPSDHTGDANGKCLIVNASFTTGEFYSIAVNGLCENTTYEFSSWLMNILPSSQCGGNGIPVNVQFEIWDITNTSQLASGNTGNINGTATPIWEQYGLVFQTLPGQTAIILKMINNGAGGCGNDLAIDDIVFKSCGDAIAIEDNNSVNSLTLCSTQTPNVNTITVVPDNSVFSTHFYQWQISTDSINWSDIAGETGASLSVSGISSTTYYRTKVAEYAANLNNSDCIAFSDVYEIIIIEAPAEPTIACWETATFSDTTCSWTVTGMQPEEPTDLECWQTTSFNTTTCSWDIIGAQPIEPAVECWETTTFNSTTCLWEIEGTQPEAPTNLECWESTTFNDTSCSWIIDGTQPEAPTNLECWETTSFNSTTCSWDISGEQPEEPSVQCWETATFNTTTCLWEIVGTQPEAPTNLECWQMATFSDDSCSWVVEGTQPEAPTDLECWETTSFNSVTCEWQIEGEQAEEPINLECWESSSFNSNTCSWEVSGTEPIEPMDLLCWQSAAFNEDSCEWEIIGTQPLEFSEEYLVLCVNDELILEATSTIENASYIWESGELSQSITIDTAGIYEVEVTDGCFTEIITFNVTLQDAPVIESVETDGSSIIINVINDDNYLYSLNGIDYQFNNVFSNQEGGLYTVYVKSNECDLVTISEHFHFFIQKFITPNGDGVNDIFKLNIAEFFTKTEVYIYNRYGKLLYSAINRNAFWEGDFNGNDLPTSDYWYRIVLDGQEFRGHFSLKR